MTPSSSDIRRPSSDPMEGLILPSDTQAVKDFLRHIRLELNRSPLTLQAYGRDLRQFAAWLTGGEPEHFAPADVTSGDIRGWLMALARGGDTPRTLRRKTQSLRAFWRYLMKRGVTCANPAADVVLARVSRDLPEFAKPEQIEAILEREPNPEEPFEVQSHLIITLLYSTGIRQAELLQLDDTDIHTCTREAIITGKRSKQRLIPLPVPLLEEIARWQTLRDATLPQPKDGSPLFRGHDGKRLSKSRLYAIVRERLLHTSATHKGAHTLRHTFATAMLNNGADLDAVKEFLGHQSLSTTQIYTHLSFQQLRKDYDKAHPREKNKKNTSE